MSQSQGDIIYYCPVHRYWSELRQNGLYTTSIEALSDTMWKESYKNEGDAFHVLSSECMDDDSVSLFRCRDRDEVDSILTTSPMINCSDSSRYAVKEQIGRCYPEKGDNDDLVALHRFYSAAITDHLYKTDKDAVDGYEYEGIECYVYSASASTASTLKVTEQEPQVPVDLIFILDSSGSVAVDDDDLSNWQAEIDFVATALRNLSPSPSETRIGLINFSGCGPQATFAECQQQNKLKNELSLTSIEDALAHLDSMGSDDFNAGFTWTDEALGMALAEFEANSSPDHNKWIFLLTDGEPYPPNQGHEPCKSSKNFHSETVAALYESGVTTMTFGIGMDEETMHEYFGCFTFVNYAIDDFDFLAENAETILKDIRWIQ